LSAKNIKDGELKINSDSDRKISWSDFQIIHGNFNPLPGDVLLTIVGSIGESCVLKKADGIAFQRSVAFLRPTPSTDSFFLKAGTETQHFQNELNDRKSSSAQAGIYLGALSLVPIRAPCLLEQKELGRFFIKVDFAIALHQRKCF
jgi:Type I restriction modification DNA specificity domain.